MFICCDRLIIRLFDVIFIRQIISSHIYIIVNTKTLRSTAKEDTLSILELIILQSSWASRLFYYLGLVE